MLRVFLAAFVSSLGGFFVFFFRDNQEFLILLSMYYMCIYIYMIKNKYLAGV